jgi:hypothetical protein
MVAENIPFPLPIVDNRMMRKIKKPDVGAYQKIPFDKNKVLLEIPFYFGLAARNSIYTMCWHYHKNVLINGKVSVQPPGYLYRLKNIIGGFQKKFPHDPQLKKLIQNYSLDYIIFHWDLLRVYHHNPEVKKKLMPMIRSIKKYGKIILDNQETTVLQTQEYIPVKSVIRTYSLYHLKDHRVHCQLKSQYSGLVSVFFNHTPVARTELNDMAFNYSFKDQRLKKDGNLIEFRFDSPVLISEVSLAE